jgi:hypothetical protein
MISRTQASNARDPVLSDTGSSSPIRGRDEQLQMITGFLERVRAGAGGVVIIEGAAGRYAAPADRRSHRRHPARWPAAGDLLRPWRHIWSSGPVRLWT